MPLIDKALLTLEIDKQTALFILLSADGSIHRKGNGSIAGSELPLKIGVSADGHLEALMMTVPPVVYDFTGVIKNETRDGKECVLSIIFSGHEGEEYLYRVVYGDQSDGPPLELATILVNAVKITEPWYQAQLNESQDKKMWWQFWK